VMNTAAAAAITLIYGRTTTPPFARHTFLHA
jgi:hypothetical protein